MGYFNSIQLITAASRQYYEVSKYLFVYNEIHTIVYIERFKNDKKKIKF